MMRDFGQEAVDAMCELIEDQLEDVHTSSSAKIGDISDNHTADITPNLRIRTDDGTSVPYPKIPGVKILMPCGKNGSVGFAFPVKAGDGCVALFGEGGAGEDFKFDLSNALAIPGLNQSATDKVKKAGDTDAAIMFAGDTYISVKEDEIKVSQGGILVTIKSGSVKLSLGATTVEATNSSVSVNSPTVSVTAPTVDVTGNVSVKGILTLNGVNMNLHTHTTPVGQSGPPM